MKYFSETLVVQLLTLLGYSSAYAIEFPRVYSEIATRLDCNPVLQLSFTDEKPFINLETGSDKKIQGAFWCEISNPKDEKKHLLVIVLAESESNLKVIAWHNHPRPLSIFNEEVMHGEKIYSLKNHKEHKFENLEIKGAAVISSFDGFEEVFFEKDGDWYYLTRD